MIKLIIYFLLNLRVNVKIKTKISVFLQKKLQFQIMSYLTG